MSRILVVEDEPAIAELIAINLRHAGFEVTVAGDADAAQEAVDGVLPTLVVLDWMLPGRSGHALVRHWRAAPRTRELPIIMLTARVGGGRQGLGPRRRRRRLPDQAVLAQTSCSRASARCCAASRPTRSTPRSRSAR